MKDLMDIISNPMVWKALIGFWVFSAFVGALPMPEDGDNKLYKFFFSFMHGISGNLSRAAVAFKVPGA